MKIHREFAFEESICAHLGASGWLYEPASHSRYDAARALFLEDAVAWVQETQLDAWAKLTSTHGAAASGVLGDRLRAALDSSGVISVLRNGFDVIGLKGKIQMCQFKPALGMNAALLAAYTANRVRVVNQVRYSLHNGNELDLVFFVNGIPVATVELKSHYTQSIHDAVEQYMHDRLPKSGRNTPEPLLSFPGGAAVHFAVSNAEAQMCTQLKGPESRFLPFNKGYEFGAGNPPNPTGSPTAYLWEQIWQRDSWLEILGRYVNPVVDTKKKLVAWIFPRFHQLVATRKIVAAVLKEGAGGKYLIQHSAGSGKTNSIAWTAHFLADLHTPDNQKVFDTVLVVSDRTVLNEMLQRTIESFERTLGVVAVIKGDGGSKSQELAAALEAGKKIIVCTIQTFPHAIQEVRRLTSTKSKKFAVIADEAHSSQTGKAAADLKMVLTTEEQEELADGGEFDMEDLLAATMSTRAAADEGISYVAFTATPKPKTIELFGRRPDPTRPAGKDNLPRELDLYSMKQAIEEGFILDVLQNYTAYKLAFQLTHEGRELNEEEVDASEARKGIMGWVRLHPVNIAARVQIVVEHFRLNVAHLIGGQAKAMVVTSSRKEAVRWMKAMSAYIQTKGYPIGLLVAFSGQVQDEVSGPDEFTENNMNLGLNGRDIVTAFATTEYSILLVANKFQTGFDQPLLSAMYVDRRLGGIQAVQTLSRLNRAYPGKDTTYVVDFVNDPDEVLKAFKQYHATAELANVSDPNVVLELRNKLDGALVYDRYEVDRVATVAVDPHATQPMLDAALGPVSSRALTRFRHAQQAFSGGADGSKARKAAKDEMDVLVLFKRDLGSYVRVYEFLSQMFDYGNTDFEKLYLFGKLLYPLLTYGREREGVDLAALKLTHHKMRDLGQRTLNLAAGEAAPKLTPMTDVGSGAVQDKQKARLSEIVEAMNGLFNGELTEGDKVSYSETLRTKLLESDTLRAQASANTKEQFSNSPSLGEELLKAIMDAMTANRTMSSKALSSDEIQAGLLSMLLGPGRLWEGLREQP
jgi:type I restriction enzyme R subunit